jgi:hypothetical protein
MSSFDHPVSLSDEQLSHVTLLAEPLVPADRSAFLAALANLLRQEPAQPVGDGVVFRHARALLGSGNYRRANQRAVDASAPRHQGATGKRARA